MSVQIMPLDDFLKLNSEEQVENLKRWKMDYNLKDIRDAWGFKHSAQYYMLLKKLRIYERVVNKSDKFFPDQLLNQSSGGNDHNWRPQAPYLVPEVKLPSDQFNYQLNTTLSGPELAEKLDRVAQFLRGENKQIAIKLTIEAADEQESASEQHPDN
ncbi:hypothetical protein ACFO9Q_22650 [Paenibacillus sp. GCM10023252]|uniref:hypothetical protein n=1 Tax=Paenibacillus sp. GCM10023252 TaxID=3252649 RepID=UPI0036118E12